MTHSADTLAYIDECIGPRRVGGRYRSYYWDTEYEVLAIDRDPADTPLWSITVKFADRSGPTQHCTPWDSRDRVVTA